MLNRKLGIYYSQPGQKQSRSNKRTSCFYHGRSMLGTFQPGDYLHPQPVALAALRPGDVVLYHNLNLLGEKEQVVHRVLYLTENGLITQGDNNPQEDSTLVNEEMLIGKVSCFERKGKRFRVYNGRLGLIQFRTSFLLKWINSWVFRLVRFLLGWFYRWLRISGWIKRYWKPKIQKVLLFNGKEPLVKYAHQGKTVAIWHLNQKRWFCKKPFDLVIKEPKFNEYQEGKITFELINSMLKSKRRQT